MVGGHAGYKRLQTRQDRLNVGNRRVHSPPCGYDIMPPPQCEFDQRELIIRFNVAVNYNPVRFSMVVYAVLGIAKEMKRAAGKAGSGVASTGPNQARRVS